MNFRKCGKFMAAGNMERVTNITKSLPVNVSKLENDLLNGFQCVFVIGYPELV